MGNTGQRPYMHWQDADADLDWDGATFRWVGGALIIVTAAAGIAVAATACTVAKKIAERTGRG